MYVQNQPVIRSGKPRFMRTAAYQCKDGACNGHPAELYEHWTGQEVGLVRPRCCI